MYIQISVYRQPGTLSNLPKDVAEVCIASPFLPEYKTPRNRTPVDTDARQLHLEIGFLRKLRSSKTFRCNYPNNRLGYTIPTLWSYTRANNNNDKLTTSLQHSSIIEFVQLNQQSEGNFRTDLTPFERQQSISRTSR